MNKKDVRTAQDIEEYYNKCRKIKFAEEDELRKPSIKESILEIAGNMLYRGYSLKTVYVRGGKQCNKEKARSLDDFLRVCKYYFPDITIKEIINDLPEIMFLLKVKTKFLVRLSYCTNIRKDNFYAVCFGDWSKKDIKNYLYERHWVDQSFFNCNLKIGDIVKNNEEVINKN